MRQSREPVSENNAGQVHDPGASAGMDTAQALRALAAERDPATWAVLLDLHGAEIDCACRRVLRDEALAEDAVQETLLLIRDRAGQFQGKGPNPNRAGREWVLRAAYTTALHILRGRLREGTRAKTHGEGRKRMAQGAHHESTHTAESGCVEELHRELDRLPQCERLPVILRYYAELEYAQIATVLGCPVGTAKFRVHRGLERLRQRMALLGLIFTAKQLAGQLHGAGQPSAQAVATQAQREGWSRLLHSPKKSTIYPARVKSQLFRVFALKNRATCAIRGS